MVCLGSKKLFKIGSPWKKPRKSALEVSGLGYSDTSELFQLSFGVSFRERVLIRESRERHLGLLE